MTDYFTNSSYTNRMPVVFIGHGSPMNAIESNQFTQQWQAIAAEIPSPKAILCISAHWETRNTCITSINNPRTIHDFGGFPDELYAVQYPAKGSKWLCDLVQDTVKNTEVIANQEWGLDHGCWSVLKQMYPEANIPVVQLSLDHYSPTSYHYSLGLELLPLRDEGVLILGSGNIVHNLRLAVFAGSGWDGFNRPFGLEWALEARDIFKNLIDTHDHQSLVDYPKLGPAIQLAVPTPEHYLPLLYILALQQEGEKITYTNDVPLAGSLTMTSLLIR